MSLVCDTPRRTAVLPSKGRHPLDVSVLTLVCYMGFFVSVLPLTVSSIAAVSLVRRLAFFGALCLLLFKAECRRCKYLPIYAFFVWVFISTLYNQTDINTTFSNYYPIISTTIFTTYILEKEGIRALRSIVTMLSLMLLVQLVTIRVQVFPPANHGEITYFFGTRVRISDVFMPLIGLMVLSFTGGRQRGSYAFLCILACASTLYFIWYEQVMTAFTALLIFGTAVAFLCILKHRSMQRASTVVLLILCGLFVVSAQFREVFAWFMINVLGKDASLNGRTLLWQQAIDNMSGIQWIVGNGYANGFVFSLPNGFEALSAHSEYINMLFRFGIIGFIFLIYTYYIQIKLIKNIKNIKIRACILGCTLSIAFTGISSTIYVDPYIFVWFIACIAYLDMPMKQEVDSQQKVLGYKLSTLDC